MSDADLTAHVYLRACHREAVEALAEGRSADATRAIIERDDFLAENPQYDDGTYRAKD